MMASKFDKMKMPPRKMKGQPEPEEIKLEIGMGEDELDPESDPMEMEAGANLEAMSAEQMIEELKKQGILPKDFKAPEAPEMDEEEMDVAAAPREVTGSY